MANRIPIAVVSTTEKDDNVRIGSWDPDEFQMGVIRPYFECFLELVECRFFVSNLWTPIRQAWHRYTVQ